MSFDPTQDDLTPEQHLQRGAFVLQTAEERWVDGASSSPQDLASEISALSQLAQAHYTAAVATQSIQTAQQLPFGRMREALDSLLPPAQPAKLATVSSVRPSQHATTTVEAPERLPLVRSTLPVVYAWMAAEVAGQQQWVAVADDGELMASWMSASREHGILDVHRGHPMIAAKYDEKFGGHEGFSYDFVVVPADRRPPLAVMQAHDRWAGEERTEREGQPVTVPCAHSELDGPCSGCAE